MVFGYAFENFHLFDSRFNDDLFPKSGHFEYVTENGAIKGEQFAISIGDDGGSPRSIVHKCQFPERLPGLIFFDQHVMSIYDLVAIVFAL